MTEKQHCKITVLGSLLWPGDVYNSSAWDPVIGKASSIYDVISSAISTPFSTKILVGTGQDLPSLNLFVSYVPLSLPLLVISHDRCIRRVATNCQSRVA